MLALIPDSKIDFLDKPEALRRKAEAAQCEEGDFVENGILALLKEVLLPIRQLRAEKVQQRDFGGGLRGNNLGSFCDGDATDNIKLFSILVEGQAGRAINHYGSYEELERDFEPGALPSRALKLVVAEAICELLDPLRRMYDGNKECQRVEKLAYHDAEQDMIVSDN